MNFPMASRKQISTMGDNYLGPANWMACSVRPSTRDHVADSTLGAWIVPTKARNQVDVDVEDGLPRRSSDVRPKVEAVRMKGFPDTVPHFPKKTHH